MSRAFHSRPTPWVGVAAIGVVVLLVLTVVLAWSRAATDGLSLAAGGLPPLLDTIPQPIPFGPKVPVMPAPRPR